MAMTDEQDFDDQPATRNLSFDIRRDGRTWKAGEAHARYELTPEKIELIDGKLFWSERDRLVMLGLLLENIGVDKAVRLGDPGVWREAIEELTKSS
jgi:hypothetical protein